MDSPRRRRSCSSTTRSSSTTWRPSSSLATRWTCCTASSPSEAAGSSCSAARNRSKQGNFQRTPLGNLLPVYLEPAPADSAKTEVRLQLTREGWLQPWARLRDNEKEEQQRLSEMPEFRVLNRTGSAKPGARVVGAAGEAETQQQPALVVQRLGNGRTAALTIGDVWRWGMQKPPMHDDMDKFWRQTLRWLVTDVPGRISLQAVQKSGETNQPVTSAGSGA